MRKLLVLAAALCLACGGAPVPSAPPAPPAPPAPSLPPGTPDLTGLSGTWCHVEGWCYTYEGNTIREKDSDLRGTWRQEGDLYISQFGDDAPWVAKIETYTATQLVVVELDHNERIVYSKR